MNLITFQTETILMKFLHIDDHFVVRSGMRGLMSQLYSPCEAFEAEDEQTATTLLKSHHFDLVIMDVQIPKADMLGLMEFIQTRYPELRVLVFSMTSEKAYAMRFMKAGARGFLSKDSPEEEIKKALNFVINDRKYISPALAEHLAENSLSDAPGNPFHKLSQREFEIASMMLSGTSLGEIGKSLNLQSSTVGTHKAKIFEKLGVSNILQMKELSNSFDL